eukprot:4398718-Pyramimonas_sp.AAC.1
MGPSSLASLSTVPCSKDGAQSCLTHANEPCPTMFTMCAGFCLLRMHVHTRYVVDERADTDVDILAT